MSKFQNVMMKNPPHVIIRYARGETRDKDQYAYSVIGNMPMAHLVGFITRIQSALVFRTLDSCDEGQCVLAWDGSIFHCFVDSKIPIDPLVGTLELIKCILVDSQVSAMFEAAQRRSATGLIAPDGQPILRSK